jgi:hypothetical protein
MARKQVGQRERGTIRCKPKVACGLDVAIDGARKGDVEDVEKPATKTGDWIER